MQPKVDCLNICSRTTQNVQLKLLIDSFYAIAFAWFLEPFHLNPLFTQHANKTNFN